MEYKFCFSGNVGQHRTTYALKLLITNYPDNPLRTGPSRATVISSLWNALRLRSGSTICRNKMCTFQSDLRSGALCWSEGINSIHNAVVLVSVSFLIL